MNDLLCIEVFFFPAKATFVKASMTEGTDLSSIIVDKYIRILEVILY